MRAGSAATMMLLHKRGAPALLLPEFLKEVYVGQRTGLLHVTHGETTGVSFRSVNGEIVSGSSSGERGRLGESMVRRGLISRADLERALVVVTRQGRRLAPVLRELDLVDTPGLERALALHIREMLFTALLWNEASLLFEDQELPEAPAEDLTLRCATAAPCRSRTWSAACWGSCARASSSIGRARPPPPSVASRRLDRARRAEVACRVVSASDSRRRGAFRC
jgi:hypothetical protein